MPTGLGRHTESVYWVCSWALISIVAPSITSVSLRVAAETIRPSVGCATVTTIEALAAFAAALSPKADVDAAADAEMDAELAAMDAEEIERGAEVDKDAARAAAAEEKRKTDEKATALLQTLDCEATYPEFAEAIARC